MLGMFSNSLDSNAIFQLLPSLRLPLKLTTVAWVSKSTVIPRSSWEFCSSLSDRRVPKNASLSDGVGGAKAGETQIDIAQAAVERDGLCHLGLQLRLCGDGRAVHHGNDDAEVHFLARADTHKAAQKIDGADDASNYFGNPVEHGAKDAAENWNREHQRDDELDHVEYDVDHGAHHPHQPTKELVQAERPPIAGLIATALLLLVLPGFNGLFDLRLNPFLNLAAAASHRPPCIQASRMAWK